MRALQAGDVVFDQAAEPHHFDGVSAKRLLVVIAQCHEEEDADEKDDHNHANRGSGKQFEVKMALAEKPIADPAEDRPSAAFRSYRYRGVDRRIYHKYVLSSNPATVTA